MHVSILKLCGYVSDIVLPPRKSERIVRTLSGEVLHELATRDYVLPYHDTRVTALVWELKYRRNNYALSLAGTFLAERAMEIAEESLSKPVLVPVPMHAARKKTRGYNQTELLCEAILKASPDSFEYAPNALVRVRNTMQQQGLPKHRRLKNMLGAIEAQDVNEIVGKTCIVVDDVSTTGATVHETKRALIEGGASEVYILTLAHS